MNFYLWIMISIPQDYFSVDTMKTNKTLIWNVTKPTLNFFIYFFHLIDNPPQKTPRKHYDVKKES